MSGFHAHQQHLCFAEALELQQISKQEARAQQLP